MGALCPLLLWHAEPPEAFHWFRANERFVFTLPAACLPPIKALYVATALVYVSVEVAQWRRGEPPNVGKLYIMAASWLTWLVGTLCNHEVTHCTVCCTVQRTAQRTMQRTMQRTAQRTMQRAMQRTKRCAGHRTPTRRVAGGEAGLPQPWPQPGAGPEPC